MKHFYEHIPEAIRQDLMLAAIGLSTMNANEQPTEAEVMGWRHAKRALRSFLRFDFRITSFFLVRGFLSLSSIHVGDDNSIYDLSSSPFEELN